MRITIAERLKPYSHLAGTACVLPGSSYAAVVYPCLIRLYSLATAESLVELEYQLQIKGPVKEFTVLNDLEKERILVWGHSQKGFFRYSLFSRPLENKLILSFEKSPVEGISICSSSTFFKRADKKERVETKEATLIAGDQIEIHVDPRLLFSPISSPERLSLGNHKAQDWDLVKRRQDLTEVLPFWNRLGELVPVFQRSNQLKLGTTQLLDKCRSALENSQPDHLLEPFQELFQAGFNGILVPRFYDDQYQGIIDEKQSDASLSPLILLTEGKELIRRLFIEEKQPKQLSILPHLPTQFHCGRFIGIRTPSGRLDLEWSKKTIRQMIFCPDEEGEFLFHFKKSVNTFRLRESKKSKGKRIQQGQPLILQKNNYYFFDNFS